MPRATIELKVLVTLDVPEEFAGKVSREDLVEMARSAVPDSSVTPSGLPNGVQVTVRSRAQEDKDGEPVFADVDNVEHDICDDPDIEFVDEGFTKAEEER